MLSFVCLRGAQPPIRVRGRPRAAPVPGPGWGSPTDAAAVRAARTMATYATMDKAPVCTAELIVAHARLPSSQRPPCSDMHLVWLLIGKELGDQLSKRRGVRLGVSGTSS